MKHLGMPIKLVSIVFLLALAGCESTGGGNAYSDSGPYDPWYYGGYYYDDVDVIVPPPDRPVDPPKPTHPIVVPPTPRPMPMPMPSIRRARMPRVR